MQHIELNPLPVIRSSDNRGFIAVMAKMEGMKYGDLICIEGKVRRRSPGGLFFPRPVVAPGIAHVNETDFVNIAFMAKQVNAFLTTK
jgi:hypothetical protein